MTSNVTQPKKPITAYRAPPPTDKPIEIELLYLSLAGNYEVQMVKNTTWYRPGDWLTENIVDEICKLKNWSVTIHSYELFKKVFDLIGPKLSIL